jgi:hypothetical protein
MNEGAKPELSPESRAAISELLSVFNLSTDDRTRQIIRMRVQLLARNNPHHKPWKLTDASIARILSENER